MRIRLLLGALLASALIGVGALAGSIVGASTTSAQTSTTPQAPAATATPAPSTGNPALGRPDGGRGFHGRGFGGFQGAPGMGGPAMGGMFGGPGPGKGNFRGGAGATADMVSREISNTTALLKLMRDDLAYANGKMDTANITKWVNGADSILADAKTAANASQYGKASTLARAASQLAIAADGQMAYTLGADKLPSYNQRPMMRRGPNQANKPALTQAQASRLLARTYQDLVMKGTAVKGNATAATYLTDAQNAYKDAYAAYQAGKYDDAANKARLAGELAGVADQLVNAASAPNDQNTPVTVPAPNF